jgi:hypothetical protein
LKKKEYFGRFNIFLGEKENFGKHFLGENFSISENIIITVEAAKVLCMVEAMMPPSTKAWLEPAPTL